MAENRHIATIVAFLEEIGISVKEAPVPDDSFLPHILVEHGSIVIERDKIHPGNLLHEAGHMAVLTPSARAVAHLDIDNGMGEETASTAWAYSVALHLGIPPEDIFNNSSGFKENGDLVCQSYKNGSTSGVITLFNYGMAVFPGMPTPPGGDVYPNLLNWTRQSEQTAFQMGMG